MEVFTSEAIAVLIEYKWQTLIKMVYIQLVIYLLMAVTVLYHSTNPFDMYGRIALYIYEAFLMMYCGYNMFFSRL